MYSRTIIKQLRKWREKENRKPLVIRGARQVGKTTVIKEFGKEFDHFIFLNLEKAKDRRAFEISDDVKEIMDYLCMTNRIANRKDKQILLFIDEIQEMTEAVRILRYFYEEMPELFVIAAGSRLQSLVGSDKKLSFPVGRVEYMVLRPFSFTEYMEASGEEMMLECIRSLNVNSLLHVEVMRHFNTYALIGGMPEVVSSFLKNKDYVALTRIYNSLITSYIDDAEHYTRSGEQTNIIRHILHTGWNEAGEAIKFARFGASRYSSTQVHEAMSLLERAFVLSLCYPTTSTLAPALPSYTRAPKLIWMDTGLANYMAGVQQEYLQNRNLMDTWRGKAAEHIVAQQLRLLADEFNQESVSFWVRDKQGSTAEIDFVWQQDGVVYPIEVKSGNNSKLRSLHSFVNTRYAAMQGHEFPEPITIRIWNEPYSVEHHATCEGNRFTLINLPFYYISLIPEIIRLTPGLGFSS